MLLPASRAASRSIRPARHFRLARGGLLPLALAVATVLAQLLLPLAHLEERRQAAHRAGAFFCASAETHLPHLHRGSPGEGLPHDARHCAVCSATAQARSTLVDAASPLLLAPAAPVLCVAARAPRRVCSR